MNEWMNEWMNKRINMSLSPDFYLYYKELLVLSQQTEVSEFY